MKVALIFSGDYLISENLPLKCEFIKQQTILNYTDHLQKKANLTDITIKTYLRNLRVFLYYCMDKGYIEQFKIKLPKADLPVKELYTEYEIRLLTRKPNLKECRFSEYRNWVIVLTLLGTGMRLENIINLRIQDIDFNAPYIILHKSKSRQGYCIPLDMQLAKILHEYLSYRKKNNTSIEDYLFCSETGMQLTSSGLQTSIFRYNKKRGVMKTSLHLYRHFFAVHWLMKGGSIYDLQKILGHSSLKQTEHYAKMYQVDLNKNYSSFCPVGDYISSNRKNIRLH